MKKLLISGFVALLMTTGFAMAQSASLQTSPSTQSSRTYETPRGTVVSPAGGNGVQTGTSPTGGMSTVQTNGNGTSTITSPTGGVTSVQTPR
jgi:hypothetical protein